MNRSITCAWKIEGTSKCSPAAAVPVSTKIPEPMIAPMPKAVSDHGPRVFLRRCSGFSESEISLSMDFLAKSCPAIVYVAQPDGCAPRRLPFRLSAHHLLHLALGGAAWRGAFGFRSSFLARRPLCFFAFFFVQFLRIGHELSRELFVKSNLTA